MVEQRDASRDAVDWVRPRTSSSAYQLPHAVEVCACLPLAIWILDELDFGSIANTLDFRQLHEVVYPFALVLEMEAGVLVGAGILGDLLSNVLDLLLS